MQATLPVTPAAVPFQLSARPAASLRDLGFFGLDSIETSVFAALVTGEPCLFIGAHGAAKTALTRRLARELGLLFWAYDASKALFEDIIGFPSPASLQRGEIEYVPTPLSIWDKQFVLVDEISRATPAMQNKWLEVVRSRQVMGKAVPDLRYVFAAMNPPGYLGAHPLDAALAGRFAFHIPFPDTKDMSADELDGVIATVTEDDAPLCRDAFPMPQRPSRRAERIVDTVARARSRLDGIAKEWDARVRVYVGALAVQLRAKGLDLDGRRLGMLRRNLLAAFAVDEACARAGAREATVFRTVSQSLPLRALGQEQSVDAIYPGHLAAYRAAFEGARGAAVARAAVFARGNLDAVLDAYESAVGTLAEEDHHEVLNVILERLEAAAGEAKVGPLAALVRLSAIVVAHAEQVPADVQGRLLEHLCRLCGYGSPSARELQMFMDGLETPVRLDDAGDALAARWAITACRQEGPHQLYGRFDLSRARELYPKLRDALRARTMTERSR